MMKQSIKHPTSSYGLVCWKTHDKHPWWNQANKQPSIGIVHIPNCPIMQPQDASMGGTSQLPMRSLGNLVSWTWTFSSAIMMIISTLLMQEILHQLIWWINVGWSTHTVYTCLDVHDSAGTFKLSACFDLKVSKYPPPNKRSSAIS